MKNFLAVFDGFRMSRSTLDYSMQVTQDANAHLAGFFLDEFHYHGYDFVKVVKTYKDFKAVIKKLDEKDEKKRDESVHQFQRACEKAGIRYSLRRDKNLALQELKHESMFADMLIINEYETFSLDKEKPPTRFIKDLLGDVQCPVLIVPRHVKVIDKIILLYDGGPSSVYAIKMFSYLFGNYRDLPVEIISVKAPKTTLRLPDNKLIREFVKRHYPKADYIVMRGNAEEQVCRYLQNHKENELVVLGAYRRNELSRWFKTSMADTLMRELNTPLFVAHNK